MNIKHELEWKLFDLLHAVVSLILPELVIHLVENTAIASLFCSAYCWNVSYLILVFHF